MGKKRDFAAKGNCKQTSITVALKALHSTQMMKMHFARKLNFNGQTPSSEAQVNSMQWSRQRGGEVRWEPKSPYRARLPYTRKISKLVGKVMQTALSKRQSFV